MDLIEIDEVADRSVESTVLIEGLPGVGLVGKLAVDHLVEELESEPVRRIYSQYLPPAVSVNEAGLAELASLTVYALNVGDYDLLVLAGASQPNEAVGQYRIANAILEIAAEYRVDSVVALGGFGTGEQVTEYEVVGAVGNTDDAILRKLEAAGVIFEHENAPSNIVGMSGLLVGMGAREGFQTAGLLGLTSGFHVDPASARAVLDVLQDVFEFTVALDTLEQQAEQIQDLINQLRTLQEQEQQPVSQSSEDLRYFG